MDWRAIRFDWNRARGFLVTAEEGSLSAAARALGLTQPTLGRQVEALEAELGVTLFERVGNRLRPTAAGLDLLDHVRAMGAAAARVSLAASGQAQQIEGEVRISASEVDAAYRLPPVLAALRRAHPGISVEVVATNANSDLLRREADIALRAVRPAQSGLIARKLREVEIGFYAAPSYLEAAGPIDTAHDLSRAAIVGFDSGSALRDALVAQGFDVGEDSFPVICANQLAQWQLVRAGLGLGLMPCDLGDADPAVRRVLPDRPVMTIPLWLVVHRELNTSRRVRLVFDLLARALSRAPA